MMAVVQYICICYYPTLRNGITPSCFVRHLLLKELGRYGMYVCMYLTGAFLLFQSFYSTLV